MLKNYEYTRVMGSYKPHFKGIPDGYYPLSTWEIVMYAIFIVLIVGAGLGIFVGFLFWVLNGGLNGYVIAWSIVFLVFTILMIFLFYVGGKSRIKE